MKNELLIRAIHPGSSVWVYLAKDTWNRKHDGSVYYWSNNMMIAPVIFDSEDAALKKLKRLKIKDQVKKPEVIVLQPGVQIVELNEEEQAIAYKSIFNQERRT